VCSILIGGWAYGDGQLSQGHDPGYDPEVPTSPMQAVSLWFFILEPFNERVCNISPTASTQTSSQAIVQPTNGEHTTPIS
jgi:hypothetical protein